MRILCIMVSLILLFTGCYTNTPLAKDSSPSSAEVSFRLNDGKYILSHFYQRVGRGYHVVGTLVNKDNKSSTDFDGIVGDEQITEVVTVEFSTEKTVLGVVLLGGGIVAVFCGLSALVSPLHDL